MDVYLRRFEQSARKKPISFERKGGVPTLPKKRETKDAMDHSGGKQLSGAAVGPFFMLETIK